MKKKEVFCPNSSIFELPVFWWTTSFILGLFFLTSILIINNSTLTFRFDYIGINNILNYFKVPLSILALEIPIIALIASNHRSVQTKEQISSSREQNLFANYYKHVEEFEKYSIAHTKRVVFDNHLTLHFNFFNNARKGDFSVNDSVVSDINISLMGIIDQLRSLNKEKANIKRVVTYVNIELSNIENSLGIRFKYDDSGYTFVYYDDTSTAFTVKNFTLDYFMNLMILRIKNLHNLLLFDVSFIDDELFGTIYSIDISKGLNVNFVDTNFLDSPLDITS